ncbi:hypothetical protein COAQ111491_22105 [Comamonas aquatilis]
MPLAVVILAPQADLLAWTILTAIAFLALLGAIAAKIGGTPVMRSVWRVTFWGALAMGITAGAGAVFNASA